MVSVDAVLDLLHEKRRRYALYYLDKQDEPAPIDEVVKAVASMEENPDRSDIPDGQFKKVKISFYHTILPEVNSHEFISYNSDKGTIELTDKPHTLNTILTVAEVLERPK